MLIKQNVLSAAALSVIFAFGGASVRSAPATSAPAASAPAGGRTLVSASPDTEMDNKDQQDEAQALVDSLIDDLTGDDVDAQQKAKTQLMGMGDVAMPSLERFLQGNHLAKTKERVQAVLDELETKFKFEPTLITLHMTNEAPKKIFEELGRQAGVEFEGRYVWDRNYGGNNIPRKVTIDLDKTPFWDAVAELCKKCKVWVQSNGGQRGKLQIYQGMNNEWTGPRFAAGPITFIATNVSRTIQLNNQGDRTKQLTIQMRGLIDPKLKVFDTSYYVKVSQAQGDQGTSLVPAKQEQNSTTSGNGFELWLQAPIEYNTGKNTKITDFKGVARCKIAGQIDHLQIDDVLNAKGKSIQGKKWTLLLKDIKQQGDKKNPTYILDLVGTAPKDPNQRNRGYSYNEMGTFKLMDKDGNEFDYRGGSSSWGDKIEQQMHFGKNDPSEKMGPPEKLIWDATVSSRYIRVPVEFKDIPLPIPD